MDWSNLTFILGNLVGAYIKRKPNRVSYFRDKLIPYWILGSQLVAQFILGMALPDKPVASLDHGVTLAAISFGALWPTVWQAFQQTAIAVLLHNLKKQSAQKA